jgi:hypothetical protein
MSSPTVDKPLDPGLHFSLAIGGTLLSGILSYATYSSQHPTAFKVSFIVGAVFSLIAQVALYASKDIEWKECRILPLGFFGYLLPGILAYRFAFRKLISWIVPQSWIRPQDFSRELTCFGAGALGYTATNALFEGYHYYRSRQTGQ